MKKETYLNITGIALPAFATGAAYYMLKNKDWCMFKDKTAWIAIGIGAVAGYYLTKKFLK